jgi:hypothetical protein
MLLKSEGPGLLEYGCPILSSTVEEEVAVPRGI